MPSANFAFTTKASLYPKHVSRKHKILKTKISVKGTQNFNYKNKCQKDKKFQKQKQVSKGHKILITETSVKRTRNF